MSGPVCVLAVMDAAAANARLGVELQITADAIDSVRAAVAELIEEVKLIQRRAVAHPDDTDEDRKRNLYHVQAIAKRALARVGGGV